MIKTFFQKNERAVYPLVILFITALLTTVFFKNIVGGDFLYLHDEFLTLTETESFISFLTKNPVDFGSANTTILVVTFFDRLYYAIVYSLGLNLHTIQVTLYSLKIFLLIFLSHLGLRRLSSLYLKESADFATFIVALWYSFNTFTLIFWHGNGFSLTLLIYYSLAPLAFYYYHKSVFEQSSILTQFKAVLLIFLISFALYFFIVFAIILFIYSVFFVLLNRIKLKLLFRNFSILILLSLPLISLHLMILYDMFVYANETVNMVGNETYGQIDGGVLYQLLMWFSWGIYTYWEPRNIFTFTEYFRTPLSIIAPFIIYGLVLYGMIKKERTRCCGIFLFIFLFLVFFAKGAQEPFGKIYLFLINHSSLFRVFRTPDTKFSVGIVLVLALLLLIVSRKYKKIVFVPLLLMVILIQGYPLLSGVAIRGENTKTSSDRIIRINQEYRKVADFLNQRPGGYGYILPYPAVEFGHYALGQNENYVGADLLPKLTRLPFSYISESSGMFLSTYQILFRAVKENNARDLKQLPIRYFVIRDDVRLAANDMNVEKGIAQEFSAVFSEGPFRVYENEKSLPMVESPHAIFTMVNPIKYRILFQNISQEQLLHFYQSYDQNWKLYPQPLTHNICNNMISHNTYNVKECNEEQRFAEFNEITYIWKDPLFDNTHDLDMGYANVWKISPEYIMKNFDQKYFKMNPDGSIDFELLLYFKTQSLFYNGVILTGVYFIFVVLFIILQELKIFFRKEISP